MAKPKFAALKPRFESYSRERRGRVAADAMEIPDDRFAALRSDLEQEAESAAMMKRLDRLHRDDDDMGLGEQ